MLRSTVLRLWQALLLYTPAAMQEAERVVKRRTERSLLAAAAAVREEAAEQGDELGRQESIAKACAAFAGQSKAVGEAVVSWFVAGPREEAGPSRPKIRPLPAARSLRDLSAEMRGQELSRRPRRPGRASMVGGMAGGATRSSHAPSGAGASSVGKKQVQRLRPPSEASPKPPESAEPEPPSSDPGSPVASMAGSDEHSGADTGATTAVGADEAASVARAARADIRHTKLGQARRAKRESWASMDDTPASADDLVSGLTLVRRAGGDTGPSVALAHVKELNGGGAAGHALAATAVSHRFLDSRTEQERRRLLASRRRGSVAAADEHAVAVLRAAAAATAATARAELDAQAAEEEAGAAALGRASTLHAAAVRQVAEGRRRGGLAGAELLPWVFGGPDSCRPGAGASGALHEASVVLPGRRRRMSERSVDGTSGAAARAAQTPAAGLTARPALAAALKQRASDTDAEDLRREAVLDTARSEGAALGAGDARRAISIEQRRGGGGPLSLRQFERAEGWTLAAQSRGVVPAKSSGSARQQQTSRQQVAEAGETLFGAPRKVPPLELRRLLRHGGDGSESSGEDADSLVDAVVDVGELAGSDLVGRPRRRSSGSNGRTRRASGESKWGAGDGDITSGGGDAGANGSADSEAAQAKAKTDAEAQAEAEAEAGLAPDLVGAVVVGDELLGRNARGARYKRELQQRLPGCEALSSYFADWDRSKAVWNQREAALQRARADRLALEAAWQRRERDAKEAYSSLHGAAVDIAAAQAAELRARAGPDPEAAGATAAWMHLRLGGFKPWSRMLSPRATGADGPGPGSAGKGSEQRPNTLGGQWWGSSTSLYSDASERGATPTSRDQQARSGAEAAVLRATGAAVAGGAVARALKHYPELQALLMPGKSAAPRLSTTAPEAEGDSGTAAEPRDAAVGQELLEAATTPAAGGPAGAAGLASGKGDRAQTTAAAGGPLAPAPTLVDDERAAVGRGPLASGGASSGARVGFSGPSKDASLRQRLQLAKTALRLAVEGVDDVTPLASEAASAIAAGHWSYVAGFEPLPEEADAIERAERARRRAERLGRDPPAAPKWQGQALPPGLTFEALSASMPLVAGKTRTRNKPSDAEAKPAGPRGSSRLQAGAKVVLEHGAGGKILRP
ncbi:hypothetical protein FNF27_06650 [Cafeteria roenbergensis]|uniref:Uncharacterized protein n=2 Tax=Cafeteria roenbergensis TaxID=33653 RepID=A0A5A8DXZ1_CAFRO|nr:hypothetical protein FNF27_06650 [Cafeteria roenbergensis]